MPFFFFKVPPMFQHCAHVDTGTDAALWISLFAGTITVGQMPQAFVHTT